MSVSVLDKESSISIKSINEMKENRGEPERARMVFE